MALHSVRAASRLIRGGSGRFAARATAIANAVALR